jgi:hypothetical protein
VLPQWRP